MYADTTCCAPTGQQPLAKELFYVPPPASFIIPIFRAPTTTSTGKTVLKTTTSKIVTALLKQEEKVSDNLSTPTSNMMNQQIFENLILTNTIVATFCIILMITLTGFLIFLLIPSIRRRWLSEKQSTDKQNEDIATLSRQQSLQQFTLGPSRLNPLFDSSSANASTATQFTPFFHPHTTTTLLHPTIWTPMTSASLVSNPIAVQQMPPNPTSTITKPTTAPPPTATTQTTTNTTGTGIGRPPLPTHPPTTVQRSPKRR